MNEVRLLAAYIHSFFFKLSYVGSSFMDLQLATGWHGSQKQLSNGCMLQISSGPHVTFVQIVHSVAKVGTHEGKQTSTL